MGILLNSIAGLIRYRSNKLWDPSSASRVSLREHEVCFARFARSSRLIYEVSNSIMEKIYTGQIFL
jgi:hypothetical protein